MGVTFPRLALERLEEENVLLYLAENVNSFAGTLTNEWGSAPQAKSRWEMWVYILLALLLRLLLLLYGEWQDRSLAVKFTDVDYFVFSDATDYVYEGKSPYERSTYRYTPLLAWMLLPNIILGSAFGKIVFIVFDVGAGWLIFDITKSRGHNPRLATYCACIWLFNPLTATVSSRGNAESIMAFLVLLTLKFLSTKHTKTMSFLYAVSIHFKIYPVTYSLPLYFLLGDLYTVRPQSVPQTRPNWLTQAKYLLLPNKARLVFVGITGGILLLLTAVFYFMYGWQFLEHSYLYHVTRKDIRHNFSVYFYLLYLLDGEPGLPWVGVVTFLPQAALLVLFSLRFYQDPPLCWFLHTFIFVTFNKVCTSQYFLWYLCLLPVVLPQLHMKLSKGVLLTTSWFVAQGLWLLPAYYLEFEGRNTFVYIWLAGLLFFLTNIYIAYTMIQAYRGDCWDLGVPSRGTHVPDSRDKTKIS